MKQGNKQYGFTIVELLIVVVVIAILAAITIVSYTGIQNRANDTAVQNDLRNLGMKLREYYTLNNDAYPINGSTTASVPGFDLVGLTKTAYASGINNVYYCTASINGAKEFGLAARSKSGNTWKYTSMAGMGVYTGSWGSSGGACNGADIPTTSAGFEYKYGVTSSGVWNAWIQP